MNKLFIVFFAFTIISSSINLTNATEAAKPSKTKSTESELKQNKDKVTIYVRSFNKDKITDSAISFKDRMNVKHNFHHFNCDLNSKLSDVLSSVIIELKQQGEVSNSFDGSKSYFTYKDQDYILNNDTNLNELERQQIGTISLHYHY